MNRRLRFLYVAVLGLVMVLYFSSGCASDGKNRAGAKDFQVNRTMKLAGQTFSRGDLDRAAILYRDALKRARIIDDPVAITEAAQNLATCRVLQDDLDSARALLREAAAGVKRSGQAYPGLLLTQAEIARREGKCEDAEELTSRVLNSTDRKHRPLRFQAQLLKAGLDCEQDDPVAARVHLEAVQNVKAAEGDLHLLASYHETWGQVHLLENNPGEVALAFDREADFRKRSGQYYNMALALIRAGIGYRDGGNYELAGDRYYRAARSMYEQGNPVGALKALEKGVDLAQQAENPDLRQRMTTLFEEVSENMKKTGSKTSK